MTQFFSADQVIERIHHVQAAIPESVKLIAVTKQVPVELMQVAYEAGIRDFGESRIQDAAVKQAHFQNVPDITWHLIGHLQSNKAAKAIEQFSWIHSVDSLKLAQRLDQLAYAETSAQNPNVFLQVKILPDPSKYGWTPDELLQELPALTQCRHLNIVGLMTIPPYGLKDSETRLVFTRTRELSERIQHASERPLPLKHLSMGMSDDYLIAVAAGATMIRLGRTLFGQR